MQHVVWLETASQDLDEILGYIEDCNLLAALNLQESIESAIDGCLNAVSPAISYCIDLIEGAYLESNPEQCKAFRPAHAKPG